MGSNEDDFWNQSSSSRLNFFDEEDESTLSETDVFGAILQENTILPIHSIISNKCLKIILDDTDSAVEHVVLEPEETIRRMFHGENCLLNTYRTLENKLQMLDAALDIGDGNIIISVILFLNQTLNSNIFFTQLSKRKVAIKHYANHIIENNDFQKLADLYMATGNIFDLKDIYCLLSKDTSNQSVLYKKLEQFHIHHSQNLYYAEDKLEIQENMSFIDFQIKNKFDTKSIIEQLINLCETEWEKGNGDETILNFKKQFKLDEFQYEWVVLSVLCKMKNWDKLLSTFTKTAFLTKKRALKSVIKPDLFIIGLGRHNPPDNIMQQFLSCIGDASKSLYLAEKFKIHMYIVNYYVEQKDKMSLLKYMDRVETGSPAMYAIQSSVNNSDIKWKN